MGIQALNENVIIIEKDLNSLFIYFKLYHQLTQKQHFYTKLYESDLKIKDKLNKHSTYNNDTHQKPKKLEKQKIKKMNSKQNDVSSNNDNKNKKNDNDDFIADDDGGFVL